MPVCNRLFYFTLTLAHISNQASENTDVEWVFCLLFGYAFLAFAINQNKWISTFITARLLKPVLHSVVLDWVDIFKSVQSNKNTHFLKLNFFRLCLPNQNKLQTQLSSKLHCDGVAGMYSGSKEICNVKKTNVHIHGNLILFPFTYTIQIFAWLTSCIFYSLFLRNDHDWTGWTLCRMSFEQHKHFLHW